MKKILIATLATTAATLSFAQNPLSVHVLNLENGLPSPNVEVTLETQKIGKWVQLSQARTNPQGRSTALDPENKTFDKGTDKVTFKTGDWFKTQKQNSFFPEVPVIFEVDGSVNHYHIPLLLSPYGYSTYRGN